MPPRWCFLKIETDEGIVGWGEPVIEGRAETVQAAVHELEDYLIGKTLFILKTIGMLCIVLAFIAEALF